jgi:hypothetical protein
MRMIPMKNSEVRFHRMVACGRRKESAKSNPRASQRRSMISLKEPRSLDFEVLRDRLVLDPMVSTTIHNA